MNMEKSVVENRKAWTAALRSGEYTQTLKRLAHSDGSGHCCLGVGCEVVRSRGVAVSDHFLHYSKSLNDYDEDSTGDAVRAALGISDEEHSALVGLNDHGSNFAYIADEIDARTAGEP